MTASLVTSKSDAPATTRATPWLAAVALVLTAINLRPAVTSIGPVLEEVRGDLGMSATIAGLLTSVPAFCFALIGVSAPRLARRFGPDAVILAGILALTAGLALRPLVGGTAPFLALSAVALGGIALVNVLLPVFVKQFFPDRVGPMTGVYTTALNVGATAAAAVTVPIASGFGDNWRIGLGTWAVIAATAIVPWPFLVRRSRALAASTTGRLTAGGRPDAATGPAAGEATAAPHRTGAATAPPTSVAAGGRPDAAIRPMGANPIAWALAVFFGLQATAAYVIMGWLPQVFRDAGLSASTAGLLFAVTSLLGVPLSYVLGALAGRLKSQSLLAASLAAFGVAGYLGLLIAPAGAPWAWAVLLGISNCSFPLALAMIGLRGRDAATVGRLSAFAQSAGYLLSIPGPVIVGALYQHDGDWHAALIFLIVLMVVQCAAGAFAGRNRPL